MVDGILKRAGTNLVKRTIFVVKVICVQVHPISTPTKRSLNTEDDYIFFTSFYFPSCFKSGVSKSCLSSL